MIQKLKNILFSKRGSTVLYAAAILLGCAIIGSAAMEYRQGYIIARGVNEMMEKATVTMATNNSYNSYSGVRESRSNAFSADGVGGWNDRADTGDLKRQLCKMFDFQVSGNSLINYSTSGLEYELNINSLTVHNELTTNNALRFEVKYQLRVPFRFMGKEIVKVEINRKASSSLTPKF